MHRSRNQARTRGRRDPNRRHAAAAVELAFLLPVLSYVTVVTIDYSRLFFMWSTIASSAFDGAMYASSASVAAAYNANGNSSVSAASLSDASDLTASATNVTATNMPNGDVTTPYPYVEVTVTYKFTTQFNYPGIPNAVTLSRKLRMLTSPS